MEGWYLVAIVVGFFASIALVNAVFYAPAFRAGYRPWKDRPRSATTPTRVGEPHARISGRMVSGWSPRNPVRFEMTADASGALVVGSGPRVWIEKDLVRGVEVVRWWLQPWILFDSDDRRFGSSVFRPDDLQDALRALRALGWPVAELDAAPPSNAATP